MKYNILDSWEKKVNYSSSHLNPAKSIIVDRNVVLNTKQTLLEFFGQDFFELDTFSEFLRLEDPEGSNWLHALLTSDHSKAINQVFELVSIIDYYQQKDREILTDLKNFAYLKSFRQFRDYYFELFTFYLFDRHNLKNIKKIKDEEIKDIEGVVTILGNECLFECKKLYYNKVKNLKFNVQVIRKLAERFSKKSYPIIISITYDELVFNFADKVVKEVNKIIHSWENNQSPLILPIKNSYYEGKIELYAEPYSEGRVEELVMEAKGKNYVVLGIRPDFQEFVQRHGHFLQYVNSEVSSSETEIRKYLIKAIDNKRKNRSNSQYEYRIYLFESENYPGFDRGLLSPNGLSEETVRDISRYLDSKKTKDVFILIEKESNNIDVPRIRRTIIGNSGTEKICNYLREEVAFDPL